MSARVGETGSPWTCDNDAEGQEKSQVPVCRATGRARPRAAEGLEARACQGMPGPALGKAACARAEQAALLTTPLHRKVKGEPGTCSSGETEVQALGLCRGRLDVGRLDHAALPRVRIRGARLSRTRGGSREDHSREQAWPTGQPPPARHAEDSVPVAHVRHPEVPVGALAPRFRIVMGRRYGLNRVPKCHLLKYELPTGLRSEAASHRGESLNRGIRGP